MSRPSHHKALMGRLDRLIDALEQGNAIACARLKLEVQAATKEPPPETKQLISSADDQIKAALQAQQRRLAGEPDE